MKTTVVRTLAAAVFGTLGLLLILPAALLVLPFWAVAAGTRAVARRLERRVVPWHGIVRYEPGLGWAGRPHLDAACLAEPRGDVFRVATDAEGWRGPGTIEDASMVVFGDSFAFGYGVDDADGYWEHAGGLRIKPIGVPGYNMAQTLVLMRRYAARLEGKLVVWFAFVANDLWDNLRPHMLGYRTPFVCRPGGEGEWRLETGHVGPGKWPYSQEIHVAEHHAMLGNTYSDSFRARRAYAACDWLIGEAAGVCHEAGAELVVASLPDLFELTDWGRERLRRYAADPESFDPDLPHRRIADSCERRGLPCVSAKEVLEAEDFDIGDRHWNRRGNRRIGGLLARTWEERAGRAAPAGDRNRREVDGEAGEAPVAGAWAGSAAGDGVRA